MIIGQLYKHLLIILRSVNVFQSHLPPLQLKFLIANRIMQQNRLREFVNLCHTFIKSKQNFELENQIPIGCVGKQIKCTLDDIYSRERSIKLYLKLAIFVQ